VIVQVYASGGFKRQLISSAASRYPLVLDVRVGFYEPKRPFTGMGFSRSAGIAAGALQGLLAPIVVPKKRAMADSSAPRISGEHACSAIQYCASPPWRIPQPRSFQRAGLSFAFGREQNCMIEPYYRAARLTVGSE
jgi:hypothetical protein